MSSLYNLYISQSYQGLIHFASNSASVSTLGLIEDGLGNSLGLYLNNNGDLRTTTSISSSTIEATNLVIKNKIELTGSIDIDGPVTASTAFIENDLIVSGTLFAKEVHTLIESSSIIFSSGSNILGDSALDTQTLNGDVIMSGSGQLTGSMGITGDLNVLGNISSSTISGIGNVTLYSQSVDSRLDYLEGPFSTSVDYRLDQLENFTGSQGLTTTASFNAYTASTNADLAAIHQTTASLNTFSQSIQTNFNAYTQSNDTALNNLSASVANRFTYTPTTGSNTFVGTETIVGALSITGSLGITGSMVYSGSVRGVVIPLTVTSQTASMDCSLGNFFTLTLVSGSNTHLTATNIQPGETIGLRITQPSVNSTLTYSSVIKFPQAFPYFATPITGAVDILSFQSYDTSALYGVAVNTMI